MKITRIAAIDIGSNSLRLLITNIIHTQEYTHYKKVSITRLPVRLGKDVFASGEISKKLGQRLVDSILLFAPGYSLLFLACVLAYKRQQAISRLKSAFFIVVVLVVSATSLASMYLDGAGIPILAMTGFYSVVVTAVGLMGLMLVVVYGGFYAPKPIMWVSLGLLLAALADAIIGAFWIYGNQGQGFYPQVRYINWFIYISSQCLVIHLAKVVALAK